MREQLINIALKREKRKEEKGKKGGGGRKKRKKKQKGGERRQHVVLNGGKISPFPQSVFCMVNGEKKYHFEKKEGEYNFLGKYIPLKQGIEEYLL